MELGRLLISSEDCVFTAPCVPTGKKQGVETSPWLVCRIPDLAEVFWSWLLIEKMDFKLSANGYYSLLKAETSSSTTTFRIAAMGTASSMPMMPPTEAPSRTKIITIMGWMPTLPPIIKGDMTRLSINWTMAKTTMMRNTYNIWMGMTWSVMRYITMAGIIPMTGPMNGIRLKNPAVIPIRIV